MWENVKAMWRDGGMLTRLVWVNAAVFVLLMTLDVVDQLGGGVVSAVLPAEGARTFATSWRLEVLAKRPWSVLTHMFTHQGVWHIAMNMLLLFWMGRVYQGEVGSRRLLSTYLAGGLAGFAAYFLITNGFKPLQSGTYALGASASVMAIFGAIATLRPELKFNLILFGPVSLKHLFWGYVVLDYFGLSRGVNAGGNVAHLGGAFFGVMLVLQDRKGRNLVGWLEWLLDALTSRSLAISQAEAQPVPGFHVQPMEGRRTRGLSCPDVRRRVQRGPCRPPGAVGRHFGQDLQAWLRPLVRRGEAILV